jgi:peptidoglycan hydrolase-like protein with peptidoglycan-binding domain
MFGAHVENYVKKVFSILGICAISVASTSCSGSQTSIDKELTFATGVWAQFEKSLGDGTNKHGPFINGDEIFATSFAASDYPENFDCLMVENFLSGSLKIYKYSEESFLEVQSIDLFDTYVEDIGVGDLKDDSTQEIVLSSRCYKGGTVKAFELLDGQWTAVPNLSASTFQNGILMNVQPDCTPSCADGGVGYTRVSWNGSAFIESGTVTSDGKPINLQVSLTCPSFRLVTSLPLEPCDEGKLVEQLIALAKNISTEYGGAEISSLTNRYTPALAQWLMIYQYRHGSEPSTTIRSDMYSTLGNSWSPDELSPEDTLFFKYCSIGTPYNCESYSYLWPTESCSEYRTPSYEFPVRRCETGAWVYMISNALADFDGKEFKDELGIGLFDEELEERVKNFQKARKIEVDGLVGANTWRALFGKATYDWDDQNNDGLYGPGDIIPH